MLVLRDRDVLTLLSSLSQEESRRLLERLHDILREFSRNTRVAPEERMIHQPERESITTKLGNTSLFMPSSTTTSTGIKVVTLSSGGLKGSINVFAPEGDLLGVLNAAEVTAFRTALAVMIPYARYQHSKAKVVVFGAGRQAEWHIKLALLLSDIKQVTVVNRSSPRRMELLFEEMAQRYPETKLTLLLKTAPDYDSQLRSRLEDSDVIFCCTPATTPHFPYTYLSAKPRFISLIGSYKPFMQEVDSQTLLSGGRIYVDTKEGCLVEAGELIKANVTADQLIEIGELHGDDPLTAAGNVVFKCVGLGIMDIVIARELLAMAEEKGLGLLVDDF
ncbi:ornithine cyclodeaminase [Capronia coronata CBS 617.96]|uniref:Ornithine cyclodeaminase n=1 Tax=Capronia coronata CBS 617.96 TaxID=1182541 RepID=W9YBF6_9EURO|nr:ornithine cyclodeaminase [Capronia coronata CBS 617.96]EXJ90197.1 ornithine cyclodeaminase [Capronia coronata CBS 617.96]